MNNFLLKLNFKILLVITFAFESNRNLFEQMYNN